jgi:threonine-phosphate decarboxylase
VTGGLHGGELEWVVAQRRGVPIDRLTSFANTVSPIMPTAVFDLRRRFSQLYLYAPREPAEARKAIAKFSSVSPDQILVGAGSTELIHLFFQTIAPGHVVIPVPTYSEYASAANRWGCPITFVPMRRDFELDLERIKQAVNRKTRAIILCNPNNPTGRLYARTTMDSLVRLADQTKATVLVDEAYLCFVHPSKAYSMALRTKKHNVVVIDSMSKLSGAPSLRLGWMVANRHRISTFGVRKIPGTIGNLALWLAPSILADRAHARKIRKMIARERQFLEDRLSKIRGLTVFHSDCNFILVRLNSSRGNTDELFEHMAERLLVIRAAGNIPGLNKRFFRVTVRTHSDNLKLVRALNELLP